MLLYALKVKDAGKTARQDIESLVGVGNGYKIKY